MRNLDINIFKANAVELFDYIGTTSFFKETCYKNIIAAVKTCNKPYDLFINFKYISTSGAFGKPLIQIRVLDCNKHYKYHNIIIKRKEVILLDE